MFSCLILLEVTQQEELGSTSSFQKRHASLSEILSVQQCNSYCYKFPQIYTSCNFKSMATIFRLRIYLCYKIVANSTKYSSKHVKHKQASPINPRSHKFTIFYLIPVFNSKYFNYSSASQ